MSTPISTYMSVVLPCLLVQRRARATVSHLPTWLPELPCILAALAARTHPRPGGGGGAMPHVRSPSLRMFTELLSDSVSSCFDSRPCPSGCSRRSRVIVRQGLRSGVDVGCQRVPLADDDAEDAGDALQRHRIEGEHGQSTVVLVCHPRGRRRPSRHWPWGPRDLQRMSLPILPLSSSSSVRRHSRSAVPTTSSASASSTRAYQSPGRCGPERHPITGRRALES